MADAKIVLSAEDRASRVLQQLRREMADLQGSTVALRGALGVLGGAFAGAFSVAGLVGLTRSVANGLDKLNDLADTTGDTVENLSALEDVALRTGTSMDTASDAVIKLNKALDDARKDKGSAAGQAIRNLGLEVDALLKLSPVERLQAVGRALNSFDGENKLFYNLTLLGKGARELAPLLKDIGEAGKLVPTVTAQAAQEAEKFNKELSALGKNATDAGRAILGPLITGLNDVIGRFREGTKEGGSFWTSVLGGRKLAAIAAGKSISEITSGAVQLDSEAGAGRGFVNPDVVKPSLREIAGTGGGGGSGKNAAAKAAEERRRLAEQSARAIVDVEEQAAEDAAEAWKFWERQQLDAAKERADAEKEQWRQVFEFIDQQQEEAIEAGQAAIANTARQATDEWSVFADQAARNIQDALGDTLQSTMEGNWRAIGDSWKRMLDRMVAEALAAKLGAALLGDFGKTGNIGGLAGDAIGFLASLFKGSANGNAFGPGGVLAFANGGIVNGVTPFAFGGGRLGVMGEAGPEAVVPLKRGRDGKLGVGGGIVVNQVINVSTSGPADRRSMTQLQAEIGIATQRAIARNS